MIKMLGSAQGFKSTKAMKNDAKKSKKSSGKRKENMKINPDFLFLLVLMK